MISHQVLQSLTLKLKQMSPKISKVAYQSAFNRQLVPEQWTSNVKWLSPSWVLVCSTMCWCSGWPKRTMW